MYTDHNYRYFLWLAHYAYNLDDTAIGNQYFNFRRLEKIKLSNENGDLWLVLKGLQREGLLKITKQNADIYTSLFPGYKAFTPEDNRPIQPKKKRRKPSKSPLTNPFPKLF